MIEQGIYARLSTDSAIAALVGTRIEPVNSQESSTLPRIVFERVGSDPVRSLTGSTSGLVQATYDIDCIASTYSGSKDLADLVRNRIDNWAGNITGTGFNETVYQCNLIDDSDEFTAPRNGSDRGDYIVRQTYSIWYGVDPPH